MEANNLRPTLKTANRVHAQSRHIRAHQPSRGTMTQARFGFCHLKRSGRHLCTYLTVFTFHFIRNPVSETSCEPKSRDPIHRIQAHLSREILTSFLHTITNAIGLHPSDFVDIAGKYQLEYRQHLGLRGSNAQLSLVLSDLAYRVCVSDYRATILWA